MLKNKETFKLKDIFLAPSWHQVGTKLESDYVNTCFLHQTKNNSRNYAKGRMERQN